MVVSGYWQKVHFEQNLFEKKAVFVLFSFSCICGFVNPYSLHNILQG